METIKKLDRNRPLPNLPEKFITTNPTEDDLLLAENCKANATIVFAKATVAAEAAIDLADHLRKITGANFTLMADKGNIIVTGKADPTAIINKLTNAILSLGGNV